jgi:hypothetical protein
MDVDKWSLGTLSFGATLGIGTGEIPLPQGVDVWTAMLISVPKKNVSFSNINFSLYFNNSPISSDKDVLINSFFPNSSTGNGAMCVGATLSNISFSEDHPPSIKEIVNIIYNDYFSGGWNADINNLTSASIER